MIGLRKKQQEALQASESAAIQTPATGEGENGHKASQSELLEQQSPPASTEASASGSGGRGRGRGATIWGVKGAAGSEKRSGNRKLRPGEIRVQKDISDLDGGNCAVPRFPDANDLMNFEVIVAPDSGYWAGYQYTFTFQVPDMYPHEPPKVRCLNRIYHPNIDLAGNVCLNILRAEWKPVLDINAVIYGLILLFEQPNPEDPLNHEAAKCLRESASKFKSNVDRSIRGADVDGVEFPPAIRAPSKKGSGR